MIKNHTMYLHNSIYPVCQILYINEVLALELLIKLENWIKVCETP